MKRILCAALWVALCSFTSADPATVPPESMNAWQGAPLTTVTHLKPSFVAMTPGRGGLALFGAFAAFKAGNDLVKQYQIGDPAETIAARLAPVFADKLKASGTTAVIGLDSRDTDDIAKAAGGKGVALFVETTGWGFGYYSLKWGRYHIGYSAQARIVDAATGKLIAKAPCGYTLDDEEHAPDYDAMMADDAALIKSTLATAVDTCVATLQKTLLGP